MSSWRSAEAAHPIKQPLNKHDLFGPKPWPLPPHVSDDILNSSETSHVRLNSSNDILSAFTNTDDQSNVSNTHQKIASVYTYPDGPTNPILARALFIVGYVERSNDFVQRCLDKSSCNPQSPIQKCTLGVHRADGLHGRKLPRDKLSNSMGLSQLTSSLWHGGAVVVAKLDNHGRVGILAPPVDLPPGVEAVDAGGRGSFACVCVYSQIDTMREILESCAGVCGGAGVDVDEGPVFKLDDDGENDVGVVGGENHHDDSDVPMFNPPQDDDENDQPLWTPGGGGGGGDGENGDSAGGGVLWQPPGSSDVPGDGGLGGDDNDTPLFEPPGQVDDNGGAGGWGGGASTIDGSSDTNFGAFGGCEDGGTAEMGANEFHADEGAAAADKFYSNLTREMGSRADSRLFHMRAFNGWVKAMQIAELNPNTNGDGDFDEEDEDGGFVFTKKRKRGGGNKLPPMRVLDLACGKGGDLGKWILHGRGVSNYVGIDVARGSLKDAAIRAQRLSNKLRKCTFVCADLGNDVPGSSLPKHSLLTWEMNKKTQNESEPQFHKTVGGGIAPKDRFDVVSIQFAIHYMMQTRKRARRFFRTVSDLLEIGGNLIATTIDARVVCDHLMKLGLNLHEISPENYDGADVVVKVGDGQCRLKFDVETVMKILGVSNPSNATVRKKALVSNISRPSSGGFTDVPMNGNATANHANSLGGIYDDAEEDEGNSVNGNRNNDKNGGGCNMNGTISSSSPCFNFTPGNRPPHNTKTVSDDESEDDPIHESKFGWQYTFTLTEGEDHGAGVGEAVDLPEWLTPIPVLTALAAEAGLEVTSVENFHEFFEHRSDVSTHAFAHNAMYNMHVLARDGSIARDEWEISRMYMAIKFTKIRQASVPLEDSDSDEDTSQVEEGGAGSKQEDSTVGAGNYDKANDNRDNANINVEKNDSNRAKVKMDGKKYVMALMKAKQDVGDEMWNIMSQEEKKDATMAQLASII